jgi:hypothetical protein
MAHISEKFLLIQVIINPNLFVTAIPAALIFREINERCFTEH